jgi:hypothetical protein
MAALDMPPHLRKRWMFSAARSLADSGEELGERLIERLGDACEHQHGGIALPALDVADVGLIKLGFSPSCSCVNSRASRNWRTRSPSAERVRSRLGAWRRVCAKCRRNIMDDPLYRARRPRKWRGTKSNA